MEEPAPSRDHDPLPAVRPGGGPQWQVQRLLWLFSFLKATISLPRALPGRQPKEQTLRTAAGGGGGGKGQAGAPIGKCCLSSGISSNLFHGSA